MHAVGTAPYFVVVRVTGTLGHFIQTAPEKPDAVLEHDAAADHPAR
jgi:hypothetical protein